MIGKLVRDEAFPTMWRVVMSDGNVSDLLNRQRAAELARLLIEEQHRAKWTKGGRAA